MSNLEFLNNWTDLQIRKFNKQLALINSKHELSSGLKLVQNPLSGSIYYQSQESMHTVNLACRSHPSESRTYKGDNRLHHISSNGNLWGVNDQGAIVEFSNNGKSFELKRKTFVEGAQKGNLLFYLSDCTTLKVLELRNKKVLLSCRVSIVAPSIASSHVTLNESTKTSNPEIFLNFSGFSTVKKISVKRRSVKDITLLKHTLKGRNGCRAAFLPLSNSRVAHLTNSFNSKGEWHLNILSTEGVVLESRVVIGSYKGNLVYIRNYRGVQDIFAHVEPSSISYFCFDNAERSLTRLSKEIATDCETWSIKLAILRSNLKD